MKQHEMLTILRLAAQKVLDKSAGNTTRFEIVPGSSVYVRQQKDRIDVIATGDRAILMCRGLLGETTLKDGHLYPLWPVH